MMTTVNSATDLDAIDFVKGGGLLPIIAQDADDGRVLMLAYASREALDKTLETGTMWYHSRSRGLWNKGATSGNVQCVVELRLDCDGDTVLALVRPAGPACHTGSVSCFGEYAHDALERLDNVIAARQAGRESGAGYTAKLLADRNLRLKKLGEEAAELAVACADGDAMRATEEGADVVYHSAVALHAVGSSLADIRREMARRAR